MIAHRGLARAFVQSTEVHTGSEGERQLLRMVTVDMGRNGTSSVAGADATRSPGPIVVHASCAGLEAAMYTLNITMSDNASMLPLAVALQQT